MKNADYWRGRFSILEDSAQAEAGACISDLEKIYRDAEHTVQADLERWYGRFASNNGISLTDARKMLTTGQMEEFRWTVDQYIKAAQQKNLSPEWIKKLENASARFHISRLETIQLQIQQQAELLYGGQLDSLDGLLKDVVSNGYTRTAFEIQKGLGLGWDITALNQKKLETLLSRPWTADGKTFRDRCWENKANLVSGVQSDLTQGLLRGDGLQKITDRIKNRFGVSRYKAGRLVHTETTYFNGVANLEVYRDLGVDQIEILETLDRHTCDTCGALDGTVIPLSQYEPGITVPPFHPNCRGTTCPHYADMDGERAARNADGEVYYVPTETTFPAWKKAFLEGGSKKDFTPIVDPKVIKDKITGRQKDLENLEHQEQKARVELSDLEREKDRYGPLLELSDSELKALRERAENELNFSQLIRLDDFEKWKKAGALDFQTRLDNAKSAYQVIQDQIQAVKQDIDKLFKDAGFESEVGKKLFTSSIERLPVKSLDKSLTPEEIIAKLGGGDQTQGSCSSLGFAYAGNHNGLDVTDFRGGASQDFFSRTANIRSIANLPGVNSIIETVGNDFTGTHKLMKQVTEGKLYYLATGQHAAIIRKVESGYEFLELQSAKVNGFKPLNDTVLKYRFGCKRSHTLYGMKYEVSNILIDIDSLKGNQEFEQMLAYLNTAADQQMKGISGHVK